MRRRETSGGDALLRYKVIDDTISTWGVMDQETGDIVLGGVNRLEAEQACDKYNSGEELPTTMSEFG